MLKQSFAPIIPTAPTILLLGSLPGDLSLAQQQYYGHPQNRFWKILFHLFAEEYTTDYTQQVQLLQQQQIALWDVCATAKRPGSMDTHISDVIPNDIPNLLSGNSSIKGIFFNGQKAQKLYDQHFERDPQYSYCTLPSSSPANAQFSFMRLVEAWQIIRK